MKKLLWLLAIALMFYAANAQTTKKEQKKDMPKMEQKALKEHKCTEACSNGKHAYAHGEKGHKCTKECAKQCEKKEMKIGTWVILSLETVSQFLISGYPPSVIK